MIILKITPRDPCKISPWCCELLQSPCWSIWFIVATSLDPYFVLFSMCPSCIEMNSMRYIFKFSIVIFGQVLKNLCSISAIQVYFIGLNHAAYKKIFSSGLVFVVIRMFHIGLFSHFLCFSFLSGLVELSGISYQPVPWSPFLRMIIFWVFVVPMFSCVISTAHMISQSFMSDRSAL